MSEESWFDSGDEIPVEPPTANPDKMPKFYDIKDKGSSVRTTFLDPDPNLEEGIKKPPILTVHKVFGFRDGDKFPSQVLCPGALKDKDGNKKVCELCVHCEEELKDSDEREYKNLKADKYHCQTVLADYGNTNRDGEKYPPLKQIRLANAKQYGKATKRIGELQKIDEGPLEVINGLYGNTFKVERPDEEFIPRIGVITDYLSTPDLSELTDEPKPFTKAELLERFESDPADLAAYVARLKGQNSGGNVPAGGPKVKINRS